MRPRIGLFCVSGILTSSNDDWLHSIALMLATANSTVTDKWLSLADAAPTEREAAHVTGCDVDDLLVVSLLPAIRPDSNAPSARISLVSHFCYPALSLYQSASYMYGPDSACSSACRDDLGLALLPVRRLASQTAATHGKRLEVHVNRENMYQSGYPSHDATKERRKK